MATIEVDSNYWHSPDIVKRANFLANTKFPFSDNELYPYLFAKLIDEQSGQIAGVFAHEDGGVPLIKFGLINRETGGLDYREEYYALPLVGRLAVEAVAPVVFKPAREKLEIEDVFTPEVNRQVDCVQWQEASVVLSVLKGKQTLLAVENRKPKS